MRYGSKISVDLFATNKHGDGAGARRQPRLGEVQCAFDVASTAIENLGDISKMIEVVKIFWRDEGNLVLCLEVIFVEPLVLPIDIEKVDNRAKFSIIHKIWMPIPNARGDISVPNREEFISSFIEAIKECVGLRANHHENMMVALRAK